MLEVQLLPDQATYVSQLGAYHSRTLRPLGCHVETATMSGEPLRR